MLDDGGGAGLGGRSTKTGADSDELCSGEGAPPKNSPSFALSLSLIGIPLSPDGSLLPVLNPRADHFDSQCYL